jgi:hypothetical protein
MSTNGESGGPHSQRAGARVPWQARRDGRAQGKCSKSLLAAAYVRNRLKAAATRRQASHEGGCAFAHAAENASVEARVSQRAGAR